VAAVRGIFAELSLTAAKREPQAREDGSTEAWPKNCLSGHRTDPLHR